MTSHPSDRPISALRARMIEDMNVRGFSEKTRNDYIRNVRAFAAFVGRSPDTATAEDLRRFQHHQAQTGVRPPSINSAVAALRFFFTVTLDRPDLARRLTVVREPRRLPAVLSISPPPMAQGCASQRWSRSRSAMSTPSACCCGSEQGKGRKDRQAMLSPQLLGLLRAWWREGRRLGVLLPRGWLFPGRNPLEPLSTRQLNRAVHAAAEAAGIKKRVSPHTLRHSFSDAEMRDIWARYQEIFALCGTSPGCYIHAPDPRATLEVTQEEREPFWEKLYAEPGFGIWMGNFSDMLTNREANALASDFIARKIRQRVKDPAVAEKLIPKNHGLGTRRVPLETGYYEVYNQPNVELVDINETPIGRINPNGIKTSDAEYDFDIIIYATGFDAITGAFDRVNIRGVDGVRLKDLWQDGPQTYLGVLVEGFPNMLMVMGPHAGLGNFTRAAEYSVEWVTGLIRFATERGLTRIEATAAGVAEWTDHVLALGQGQLMNEIGSWMTGVNRNVKGKQIPRIMRYSGGHPACREHCDAVAADGYRELALA